jgi:hypothetical protein
MKPVVGRLLKELYGEGCYSIGHADDTVILMNWKFP